MTIIICSDGTARITVDEQEFLCEPEKVENNEGYMADYFRYFGGAVNSPTRDDTEYR